MYTELPLSQPGRLAEYGSDSKKGDAGGRQRGVRAGVPQYYRIPWGQNEGCYRATKQISIVFGLTSNRYLTHCIKRDKRPESEKHADELAFTGQQISITFRHIATFIGRGDASATPLIVGQGAPLRTWRIKVDEVSRTLFLLSPEKESARSSSTSYLMTTATPTTTTTTTNYPVTTTSGINDSMQVRRMEQGQGQGQGQEQEQEQGQGQGQEQARMLQAFKDETNQSFSFDWHTTYGKGFSIAFIDEATQLSSLSQGVLKDIEGVGGATKAVGSGEGGSEDVT
jgi:hypothetical protein